MIDISDSIAKKTVKFGRPIKGSELIEAVRRACGDERSFVQEHRYDDGHLYAVGRSSGYEYENVLVTPTKNDAYLKPDEQYESAVVVSHDLGGGQRFGSRAADGAEIDAVLEFADQLEQQVTSGRQEDLGRGRDPYAPAAGAVSRRADGAAPQGVDAAAASPWRDGTGRGGYNNLAR
ncbi:hypothetical protein [Kribbella sp. HUAS MG21]|uniref:Uncharacterized protein n=1 Tax=Kribbella sp. HUAS MG21 TaxID=3160966 RepID=A0AAU7TMV9_9ACTN